MIVNFSDKYSIPRSFAYNKFIEQSLCEKLQLWAKDVFDELKQNNAGAQRYFGELKDLSYVPVEVYEIKSAITGRITRPFNFDSNFTDFLSFNLRGASIHEHSDPNNSPDHIHTRFNLIISAPDAGGEPIYDGQKISIREGMLWCCQAGKYRHGTTPVVGDTPRINLSFGYQIKCEENGSFYQ